MPGSSKKGKEPAMRWFKAIPRKKYILDIGPGWGTYSKMLRHKGQVWHAVEIHEKYIKRFKLDRLYDKIFITDVKKFEPKRSYDLIICGDVLEHIDNKSAIRVLRRLIKSSSYILISLPLDEETHAPQGTGDVDWGNPHELHAGMWSNVGFVKVVMDLGSEIIAMEKYPELAIYLIAGAKKQKNMDLAPSDNFFARLRKRRIYKSVSHKVNVFKSLKHKVMTVLVCMKARLRKSSR